MNVLRNVFSTFLPTVSLSISSSSSSFPISCNKSIFKVHFHFWGNKICHEIYIFIPCYLDEWWWSMVYFNVLSCFSWSIESTKVYTYQTTLHITKKLQELFCFIFRTTFCSNWWHLTTDWERNSLINLSEVRSLWINSQSL